jgi:hypothetical protein
MCIGFVIALAAYYFLGKTYGSMGGAFAAVLTEAALVVMFVVKVKRGIEALFKGVLYNFIGYIITASMTYFLLRSIFPLLGMVIGAIIYMGIILLIDRDIRGQGMTFLRKKVKGAARG